jgi:hypothetical protein
LPKATQEEPRLKRVSDICLAFPEAIRETSGTHVTFLVRKKTFVYFLNDHHGDGIISICCKVLPGDNAALIRSDPKRFYMPAYIGPRGWVALRLDAGEIDWEEVNELAFHSYLLAAPKRLAQELRDSPEGKRLS